MNIGSNKNPVLPPANDSSVVTIAFEPVVFSRIVPHERLFVVPAAVGASSGIATMRLFAKNEGQSSSLLAPAQASQDYGISLARTSERKFVPLVTMSDALSSLPNGVELWFLKTDMQGFDATALKAGGHLLRRAHYVKSEVNMLGAASYEGASNSYCNDVLPLMLAHGFEPIGVKAESGFPEEDIKHLRDPMLYRNEGKGVWEG